MTSKATKQRIAKPEQYAFATKKYNTSERGYIINTIASIYKPSQCEKRGLWPALSKQQMWGELFLHIQEMKDKFPDTNGRLCLYCFKPWTYVASTNEIEFGNGAESKKIQDKKVKTNTNFSIDRLDNKVTYKINNIVFCCQKCNDDKHSCTMELAARMLEIKKERDL